MSEQKVLLKVKHVDVKFRVRGRVLNAIRDANIDIYDKETLAIVGESGSGKSVLTKTFAGMLDPNGIISHGNVYFYDDEISYTEVKLNARNSFFQKHLIKKMEEYSYESVGHEEYQKILEIEKEIESLKNLSKEEEEKLEKELKEIDDDINDTFNLIDTHKKTSFKNSDLSKEENSQKEKENSEKIKELKGEMAALKAKRKALVKEFKATGKKKKREYNHNTALKNEHINQIKELSRIRDEKIEKAKQSPLTEEQKKNAFEVANEIILSIGRYPLYLFYKYFFQLKKSFRVAYDLNKDLSTEKQRRRVFEPIVFRVEYRDVIVKEYSNIINVINENIAPEINKEIINAEVLSNETLIEQARALHPHLRKSLLRKISKYASENGFEKDIANENVSKIVDLILLEAGQHDSNLVANILGHRLCSWVKAFYESKKQDLSTSQFKSKPRSTLVGYAYIDCAKVRYLKDWAKIRGCKIATVFQDPMTSLNPILTIGKQIMLVIQKHQKCSSFEAKRRALVMMEKVGIPNPEKRFDDYPFQYSGGMRQRIVIAIALSCQPKILICDEPTTALDVTIQAQIIRLIKKLSKDLGFTTVYITHDLGVVANVADRVAVLYAGQIVELGTVEDIFYDPYHPYTWALLSSMPQLGQRGEELFSIPGTPPSLYSKIVGDAFAPRSSYAMAIDFVKEPPMFEINDHHWAKTWLLDPRAPKVNKPEKICNLHEKMVKIYGNGNVK